MAYLLFMDESGHDHKTMPYEVRGGVALHVEKLWPFVRGMAELEQAAFGDRLHKYKSEVKGHQLLDKDRFKWAAQAPAMDDVARRKHAIAFLNRGIEHQSPTKDEFTAYGQASLLMARGIFELLLANSAKLFAVAIPREVVRPKNAFIEDYLRKDHVFLLERYYHFLEGEQEQGLLVLDETDKGGDLQFLTQLQRYFTRTNKGRFRASRIVPTPFFVSSDITSPVQAADVCIYCLNWGFRIPHGMNAVVRQEIAGEFTEWLCKLRFQMDEVTETGRRTVYGIIFVPDPYTGR